jgi:Bacterial DNA-binding protein.
MNKHLDQSELSKIIASQKEIDPKIAESFIQQLFKGAEKELISSKSIKIDGLGTFKIIKSGSSNRILFLGSTAKNSGLRTDAGLIGTNSLIDKPIEKLQQSSIAVDSDYNKNDILTAREEKRNTLPIILTEEEVNISEKIQIEDKAIQYTSDTQVSAVEKEALKEEKNVIADSAIVELTTAEKPEPRQESFPQEKEVSAAVEKSKKEKTTTVERPVRQRTSTATNSSHDPYRYISEREETSEEDDDLPAKRRSTTGRIVAEILIIFAIVSIGFLIYSNFISSREAKPSSDKFTELDNNDKTNYSCIILSDADVSVKYLAEAYYGNKAFWPYIYKANENIVNSSFVIPSGSIIKIPKLTVDIVSFNKGELNDRAKALEEEIMKEKG